MISYRSIHFVGVLTPDMASLAAAAQQLHIRVTASDDHRDSVFAPALEKLGIQFFDMFAQTNITKGLELVVVSSHYDERHIELLAAQREKIPVMTAINFTHVLSESTKRLAILGDYESPMIATFLHHVWNTGHHPLKGLLKTVPLSGDTLLADMREADDFVHPLSGFRKDNHTYEADFLSFEAETVILPSIYYDYPDLYMTVDDVYQAYYTFVKRIPRKGLIVGNSDWPRMKRLRSHLADRHIETYGFERDATWHIREVEENDSGTTFSLAKAGQLYGPFQIPFIGSIPISAAAAVSVVSLLQGMKPETLARGLATLPKLARYYTEYRDKEGRVIIDDRADHPETIFAVLETIKHKYPGKRIWCLYQPGSYLRTKNMSADLEQALRLADIVYLADIQGYPREKSEGLHIRHFVSSMKTRHPQTYYFDESTDMTGLLADRVASTDCIVTLGADGLCQRIVAPLLQRIEE